MPTPSHENSADDRLRGLEPYFIYEGYQGLVDGGKYIVKAEWEDVRGFLPMGGTAIGSARCKAFRDLPGRLKSAKNLILHGINALIVIGGDGSLTGADVFRGEWPSLLEKLVSTGELTKEQIEPFQHLNIVGMVGSIDNDFSGTDATIGCWSALDRITSNINLIATTADSVCLTCLDNRI
jgi:6-phosphofructokinase 1